MFSAVSTDDWSGGKHSHADDFAHGATVASCEAAVRVGFLRKVFGLVAAQLAVTAAMCALFMFEENTRSFALHNPQMLMLTFFSSIGFLFAAQCNKDSHPQNLYYLFGFTVSMAWSVAVCCARFYVGGMGLVVLEAVALTAAVTAGLTVYTLNSKADFSFLGAGLGASLFVLIIGGCLAPFIGMASFHFALAVGGAVIFSLYIVFDVWQISQRLSPDECEPCHMPMHMHVHAHMHMRMHMHIAPLFRRVRARTRAPHTSHAPTDPPVSSPLQCHSHAARAQHSPRAPAHPAQHSPT